MVAEAKLRLLRDPSRLRPWLYAVARNECRRRLYEPRVNRQRTAGSAQLLHGDAEGLRIVQIRTHGGAKSVPDVRRIPGGRLLHRRQVSQPPGREHRAYLFAHGTAVSEQVERSRAHRDARGARMPSAAAAMAVR